VQDSVCAADVEFPQSSDGSQFAHPPFSLLVIAVIVGSLTEEIGVHIFLTLQEKRSVIVSLWKKIKQSYK